MGRQLLSGLFAAVAVALAALPAVAGSAPSSLSCGQVAPASLSPDRNTCGGYFWPIENGGGRIWQGFAYESPNVTYCNTPPALPTKIHMGVDIGAPVGAGVLAIAEGTVVDIQDAETSAGNFGRRITICHDTGSVPSVSTYPENILKGALDGQTLCSMYSHLSSLCGELRVGAQVRAGQLIGRVGHSQTGGANNAHLHLTTGVRSAMVSWDCPIQRQDGTVNSCQFRERFVNPLNLIGTGQGFRQYGQCSVFVSPYCLPYGGSPSDAYWAMIRAVTVDGAPIGSSLSQLYPGCTPTIDVPWANTSEDHEVTEHTGSSCRIPKDEEVVLPLAQEIEGARPLMSAQLAANKNFRRKKTDVLSVYNKFGAFLYQTSACYKSYQDVVEELAPLREQLRQITAAYNGCLARNAGSSAACASHLSAMQALNSCNASSLDGRALPSLIFDCKVRERLRAQNCPSLVGYASDIVDEFLKYGCPEELYIEAGEPMATSRKKLLQCVDYAIRRDRDDAVADVNTMLEPSRGPGAITPEAYARKYCQLLDVKADFPPVSYFKWAGTAIDFSDAACQARGSLYVTPSGGGKIPERILEPEPSSFAYNTADYDSTEYPNFNLAKMNGETGTLCRPQFTPNTPERPETRFNAQKTASGENKYLPVWLPNAACNMSSSQGNYATDHSDGFSPRHLEAFRDSYPEAGFNEKSLPTCFVCGTPGAAAAPGDTLRWGTDQKTVLAMMRWTKPLFKKCVDCVRTCHFPKFDGEGCVPCGSMAETRTNPLCYSNGIDSGTMDCPPGQAVVSCPRCILDSTFPQPTPRGSECCNSGAGGYCAESCGPPLRRAEERCEYPNTATPSCYDCPTNNESDCCQVADKDVFMSNPLKVAPKQYSWGDKDANLHRILLRHREPEGGPKDPKPSPDADKGRMTPVPEGFYFEEEFGWGNSVTSYDHRRRPYVRNFETNLPSCHGWNDALVGIGDTESNCGYGGWEELKLYQLRCQREFGLKCLCKYESTFKRRSAEEYVHRRAGITVSLKTQVLPATLTKGQTVLQDYLDLDRFWPISWRGYVSEPDPEYRFPALGLQLFSQNYDPPGNPNTGFGRAYISNREGLNDLARNGVIKLGLSEAKPGDIIIWDRDVLWGKGPLCNNPASGFICGEFEDFDSPGVPAAGSKRLPHVAFVQEAHTYKARLAQCQGRVAACQQIKRQPGVTAAQYASCQRDDSGFDYSSDAANCDAHPAVAALRGNPDAEYVVIQETNNGKFPDICGNTDRLGIETTRTLWRRLPAGKEPPPDVRAYNPNGYCSEPQLRDCEENLWGKVKVYDPRRDVRSPKILSIPGLGSTGEDRFEWDRYSAVSRTTSKVEIRNCIDLKNMLFADINNSDANRFGIARAIYQGCDPPTGWRPPAGTYIPGVGESPGTGTTGTLSNITTGRAEAGRSAPVSPFTGGDKPVAGKPMSTAEPLTTRWTSYRGSEGGSGGPGGEVPPAPIDPGNPGCPTCCWPGQLPDEKVVTLCGSCTLSGVPARTGNCCLSVTTRVLDKAIYGPANACLTDGAGKTCAYNETGNIVSPEVVATGGRGEGRVCEGGTGCITVRDGTITVTTPGEGPASGLKSDLRNLVNCARRCASTNVLEDQYVHNWSELDPTMKSAMPRLPLFPAELQTSPFDYSDKNPFRYPDGASCKAPNADQCIDAPACFDRTRTEKQCRMTGPRRHLPFTPSHPLHTATEATARDSGYDRDYVLDYLYYYSRFFDPAQSGNYSRFLPAMSELPTIGWLYDPRLSFIPDQYMDGNPGMIFYKLKRYAEVDRWTNPALDGNIVTLKSIVESQDLPKAMPLSTPMPTVAVIVSNKYYRGQMALVYDYNKEMNCVDLMGANWLLNPACFRPDTMEFDRHNCYQLNNSFGKGCMATCVPVDQVSFFWNPRLP